MVITGWKSIAAAIGVSVRTAQRLRLETALPVRNYTARTVFAKRGDLDVWLATRPSGGATWRDVGVDSGGAGVAGRAT